MAYAKPTLHSAVSIAIVRAARGSSPAIRFVAEPKKTQHGATGAFVVPPHADSGQHADDDDRDHEIDVVPRRREAALREALEVQREHERHAAEARDARDRGARAAER